MATNDTDSEGVETRFRPHDGLERRRMNIRRAFQGQGIEVNHDFYLGQLRASTAARTL